MVICDFKKENQQQKRQSRDSRRLCVTLSASAGSGYRRQILRRSAPQNDIVGKRLAVRRPRTQSGSDYPNDPNSVPLHPGYVLNDLNV